jgi:hypothetical protein
VIQLQFVRSTANSCTGLLYDVAQGRSRGGMTRVNSLSILTGNVARPNDGKVQHRCGTSDEKGNLFAKNLLIA